MSGESSVTHRSTTSFEQIGVLRRGVRLCLTDGLFGAGSVARRLGVDHTAASGMEASDGTRRHQRCAVEADRAAAAQTEARREVERSPGHVRRHSLGAATGAPWRDLPERYGKWGSVYHRFNRWKKDGTIERILKALRIRLDKNGYIDWDLWCVDGSNVRASRAAAGASKKPRRAWRPRAGSLARRVGIKVPPGR